MKLSRKLDYACRVLAQLARYHERGRFVHMDALAEIEGVPANYLVQILNDLRVAGLIASRRGKQGGYALARAPDRIGLNEIVRAVDAELLKRPGRATGDAGYSGGRVAAVWGEIGEALEAKMAEYTLECLVEREAGGMYYI